MGWTIDRVNSEDKKRLPLDQITFCMTQYKSKWDPYERDHWVLRWIRAPLDRVIAKIRSSSWHFTLEPVNTSGWIELNTIRELESAITEDDMKAFLLKLAVSHGINVPLLFLEDQEARLAKIVEIGGEEKVVFDCSREVSKRSKAKKTGKKKTNTKRNAKKKKDKGAQ